MKKCESRKKWKWNPESVSNIKLFINKYNWEEIIIYQK